MHLYLSGFPVASCLLVKVSLVQVACVAIVSTRVRRENWEESTFHPFWRSFAVWGSFAVGDHLRYCTVHDSWLG